MAVTPIRFQLRTAGNHKTVAITNLPSVPRVGEFVALPGEDRMREVHSVMWDIDENLNAKIDVMLKD